MSTRPERTDRVVRAHSWQWKAVIVGMVAMMGLAGCSDSDSDPPTKKHGELPAAKKPAPPAPPAPAPPVAKKPSPTDFPGTEAGAKALLGTLLKADTDHATATRALRPADADYDAIFVAEAAAKAKKGYAELWASDDAVLKPRTGQTELLLWSATSADIKAWQGNAADHFPGGWRRVGASLKGGLTFYRFRFVKPGATSGMSYDGLVHVNGHWVWVPEPHQATR